MSINIAVLNLMPNKIETERHLKSKICSLDKKLEFTFIKTATYVSKNTDSKYLNNHYKELNEIKNQKFDAFVCTGAPLEKIPFESVIYWKELKEILPYLVNYIYLFQISLSQQKLTKKIPHLLFFFLILQVFLQTNQELSFIKV